MCFLGLARLVCLCFLCFFFFNDTATTEIYTLSLHDALPILIDGHRWMIPLAPGRYINHSCDPNCALRDRPGDPDRCDVVTLRPVAQGEELSFSYNRVDAAEFAANRDNPSYAWNPAWS